MLKVFRDNLRYFSWILWIVIAAFILFYIPNFMTPGAHPGTAMRVWDEEVTNTELQNRSRSLEQDLRKAYGQNLPENMAERLAVNQAINSRILLHEARKLGLEVSDEELSRAILAMPGFQTSNGNFIGEQEYRRRLRRAGLTPAEFEREQRETMLLQRLQQILSDTLTVTEGQLEKAYRDDVERARIRFFQLPASQFADQAKVSDDEVSSYFDEHRAEFRLPERREVAYLLVQLNQVRRSLEIPESELLAYYQSHQDDFTREERVRARHILIKTDQRSVEEARSQIEKARARIEAGEDFAKVAREVSEDPGSAANGGDLGFFQRGQMTPEFENAAFAAKVGEVVGPVVTPFGVHLIKVEGRQESGVRPFADVRSQIQSTLAAEKAPQEVEARVKALEGELRQSDVTPERLQKAADDSAGGVRFNQPSPFGQEDSVPGIGKPKPFFDTVFDLKPGELSEPVELPNGDRALVYLKNVLPPRDQTLEEVQDQIRSQIAKRKQQQMALDRLAEAKKSLDEGKTFDEVAQELGVTPQETTEFGPQGVIQGLGYNAKVAHAALSMSEGEVGGPFESPSGALLFQVTERKTWDPDEFAKQKDALRDRLKSQQQQHLLSSLILERRDELRSEGELRIFDPEVQKLLGPAS